MSLDGRNTNFERENIKAHYKVYEKYREEFSSIFIDLFKTKKADKKKIMEHSTPFS